MNCIQSHDPELWEVLVDRLQPIFARIVYRVSSSYATARIDEVDDLVQESFLKLQALTDPVIQRASFQTEQAALSYLKVLAANTARDYFRNKTAEKRGVLKTASIDPLEQISGSLDINPDRALLMNQIDKLLNTDLQGQTIFWLYYRQGFTAKEIAAIPAFKLTAKGVESLIRRLTAGVREKIERNPEGFLRKEAF